MGNVRAPPDFSELCNGQVTYISLLLEVEISFLLV